jgi:hypothetical protein
LAVKAELGGTFEHGFRKKGDCFGGHASWTDEVLFDPTLEGGLDGDADVSDNKGNKPTGTRFNS